MITNRRRLFLCLSFPFLASLLYSQTSPQPKSDHAQEAFVIERISDKLTFENDGTFTREGELRVKIQSDAAVQHWGLLQFVYAAFNGNVTIDRILVHKPDGTVISTPTEDAQDMPSAITRAAPFYSDIREKQVAVKGLGVGDTLEYAAHWKTDKPLAPNQFWFDFNFTDDVIVLQQHLEVRTPHNRAVQLRSPSHPPQISEEAKYRLYQWSFSNLVPKSTDDKEEKRRLTTEAARGLQPQPDILLSSFKTWDEVGQWYGGLQQDRVKPTPEIEAKAVALTKGLSDDTAKLRAIYNYVSWQFRYIGVSFGIGRYQPHAAAEVLNNQYGDCKDKHTLLASLLQAAGIKSYPTLISTQREIVPEVPSPGQFDHVITAVPQANGYLWLDTTPEVAPFAYLMGRLRSKHALVIPSDKPATLAETPADSDWKATEEFQITAKLDDAGTLEGDVHREIKGSDGELLLRSAFRNTPMPQWKDLAQQLSYLSGFGGDVSDVTVSPLEATDKALQINYHYKRKDYSDWENRRISFPLPSFLLPTLAYNDDKATPSFPIWLGPPQEIHYHSEVQLPADYSLKLPSAVHEHSGYIDFDADYSLSGGKVVTDRRMAVKANEVPVADYKEFQALAKSINNDRDTLTALISNKMDGQKSDDSSTSRTDRLGEAIAQLPESDNPDAINSYLKAEQAMHGPTSSETIASLNLALAQDPKFIRAWLLLEEVYFGTLQIDKGLQTLRGALKLNTNQDLCYQVAIETLLYRRRYADAVPLLKELTTQYPDDSEAYAELGLSFFQLKQYTEAIPAYTSFIKLKPEKAFARVVLGHAYLRNGEPEKALASYQEAIKLGEDPEVLNDVAYEMAEHDQHLSEALEYAEKAVALKEADSQHVSLANLQNNDLLRTQSLAAYWDTLGWIYFKMDRLEKAARYLDAAWQLSQNPVSGDHLGQVYEKQHKTAQAIHLYRLAFAADETMSETKARLKRLGANLSPSQVFAAKDELSHARNIKMARVVAETASAEFFVLIGPQGKIVDTKFISGTDQLKSAGRLLQAMPYTALEPDNGPTHVVRRGILSCFQYVGCSFTLFDVKSLNSIH
ncbi:MAG: DUF3857 domain-containing protein [Acidobacteria bacterium]|nr:DUF3857 domain-containing protein [Acidobacteriota bacterium]